MIGESPKLVAFKVPGVGLFYVDDRWPFDKDPKKPFHPFCNGCGISRAQATLDACYEIFIRYINLRVEQKLKDLAEQTKVLRKVRRTMKQLQGLETFRVKKG